MVKTTNQILYIYIYILYIVLYPIISPVFRTQMPGYPQENLRLRRDLELSRAMLSRGDADFPGSFNGI